MNLQKPITYIKGISTSRADTLLKEMGIRTCLDLLYTFPNRYIDRSKFYKINELVDNSADVQVVGQIIALKNVPQKRGSRLVATFQDSSGQMELVWFRGQKWFEKSLKLHQPYVAFGRLNYFNGQFSMVHPELDLLSDKEETLSSSMQPVYPSTENLPSRGIGQRVYRSFVHNLLEQIIHKVQENLPESLRERYLLIKKKEALLQIHFPNNPEKLAQAQQRLKFEELFFLQLQLLQKKHLRQTKIKGFVFGKVGHLFHDFYQHYLPFELTKAQQRVLKEIRKDLRSGAQMNRLLQGDVGSGKTIVSILVMLLGIDNGFQAALIAPTEILAIQHFKSISELLSPLPIKVSLLTGSTKTKKRKEIHSSLEDGSLNVLIGTHALLEDKVQFKNLGIAIIDEQHRFGVAQRSKMWTKNTLPPHILVMTATPIPRTLAMSVYGDLDISVIDELPPGRKTVKTVHRFDTNRLKVYHFLRQEIKKGRQIYIVYPLIQESEAFDYKDLMDGYESVVREFPLPDYRVSIVHGQMKPEDKEFEMQRFVNGETQIMLATTVIEVGVNVPNASVMVIESAERFGLSQLHQLRGRVGRGADQSYCILLTGVKLSDDAKTRLETMVSSSDGFKIAEVDLKLRGPGNLMGTQQSGLVQFKIADYVKDQALMRMARSAAYEVLKNDPQIKNQEHLGIKTTLDEIRRKVGDWSLIS